MPPVNKSLRYLILLRDQCFKTMGLPLRWNLLWHHIIWSSSSGITSPFLCSPWRPKIYSLWNSGIFFSFLRSVELLTFKANNSAKVFIMELEYDIGNIFQTSFVWPFTTLMTHLTFLTLTTVEISTMPNPPIYPGKIHTSFFNIVYFPWSLKIIEQLIDTFDLFRRYINHFSKNSLLFSVFPNGTPSTISGPAIRVIPLKLISLFQF